MYLIRGTTETASGFIEAWYVTKWNGNDFELVSIDKSLFLAFTKTDPLVDIYVQGDPKLPSSVILNASAITTPDNEGSVLVETSDSGGYLYSKGLFAERAMLKEVPAKSRHCLHVIAGATMGETFIMEGKHGLAESGFGSLHVSDATPVEPPEQTDWWPYPNHRTLVLVYGDENSNEDFRERVVRLTGEMNTPYGMKAVIATVADGKMKEGIAWDGSESGGLTDEQKADLATDFVQIVEVKSGRT